ncbi:unnamed protein product [Paramecium sonneborni]|uniref:WD40-repeat-containing domain n=1 Tax=Paramecium sonneborni TaxID=65129 RepID=A0A8S1KYF9_9CILI|nr:unnamed protein product [Paramecium sonneborni]
MIEKLGDLVCKNNHSGNSIVMVLLDKDLKGSQRLLCQKCLVDNRGEINGLLINSAIEKIQEVKNTSQNELKNYIENNNQYLNEILALLQYMKTNILMSIDQVSAFINNWKNELISLIQQSSNYNFLDELKNLHLPFEKLIELEKNYIEDIVRQTKETYSTKLSNGISILQNTLFQENQLTQIQEILSINFGISTDQRNDKLQSFKVLKSQILDKNEDLVLYQKVEQQSIFKSSIQENYTEKIKVNSQIKKNKSISYRIIQEMKSSRLCKTMAFNYNDTIIALGLGNQVRLLKLEDGKLIDEKENLNGHDNDVKSIVFSKKANWFISATCRGSSRIWRTKEKKGWFNSSKWECSKSFKFHSKEINTQILNKKEDQLISFGKDINIDILGVNYDQNTIILLYQLKKHQKNLIQIDVNPNETQMASLGEDKLIILWEKDENNKWQFKYFIDTIVYDFGSGISFIFDETLVWSQVHQPFINICKMENGKFQEKIDQRLQLKDMIKEQESLEFATFKASFNEDKQMLLLKHNRYLYLIKINEQFEMEIETEPITCGTIFFYGTVTNNGKYIFIMSEKTMEFILYELLYDENK